MDINKENLLRHIDRDKEILLQMCDVTQQFAHNLYNRLSNGNDEGDKYLKILHAIQTIRNTVRAPLNYDNSAFTETAHKNEVA